MLSIKTPGYQAKQFVILLGLGIIVTVWKGLVGVSLISLLGFVVTSQLCYIEIMSHPTLKCDEIITTNKNTSILTSIQLKKREENATGMATLDTCVYSYLYQ